MYFDKQLAQLKHKQCLVIDSRWSQGRTTFGGLSAALIYQSLASQADSNKSLRNFDLSFCGPLYVAEPCRLKVELLRSGRTISCYSAQLIQNDRICVAAQATFATSIESELDINALEVSNIPPLQQAVLLDTSHDIFPNFVRNFELFFTKGDPMFSGSKLAGYQGWMRFKDSPDTLQVAHLIAMIDAWPPATSSCLSKPAALSTVNWNIKLLQPLHRITQLLGYHSYTEFSKNGLAYTRAQIINDQSQLLALSEQSTITYG